MFFSQPYPVKLTEAQREELKKKVIEVLKTVYDPEIAVNVYDLGLIYGINVSEEGDIHIKMTLTAPGCPLAGMIVAIAEATVKEKVPEAKNVEVELVWDPPWTPERVTPEGRKMLIEIFNYDVVAEWMKRKESQT